MPPDEDMLAAALAERVQIIVQRATEPLLERIRQLEARAPVPGPPGERGAAGAPGEAGPAGAQGTPGPAGEAGQPGADGLNGHDGVDGAPGQKGEAGERGKDGVGLAGALIDSEGQLVVTLTDGTMRTLGPVIGKDGVNGRDGKDGERGEPGFSLADFDTELLADGRTFRFKFVGHEHTELHDVAFPAAIYRGVFRDGETYVRGDLVTWGGSMWHCEAETTAKPGDASADWILAVKRGRDGKDGAPGPKGDVGAKGPSGRDGGKW